MMDKIEICNLALSRIGMENIDRMDEASEQARTCNQFYDACRKITLRKFPWPFATRRVQLAAVHNKDKEFEYIYRYPANALLVRKMYSENFCGLPDKNNYKIMSDDSGLLILTNVPKAWLEYTANVEDCTLFDDEFMQCLSWKLASDIAFKLTSNASIMETCLQAYNAYFMESASDAGNEENGLNSQLDSLALARFRG
ncbi:MAG: hypothetical protein RR910_08415 [Acidaminococcaceae bacterium]